MSDSDRKQSASPPAAAVRAGRRSYDPPVGTTPPSIAPGSGEEMFGKPPFSPEGEPRYYGTGVPGYRSGPGFTGGYYGYGEEPPEVPTELEQDHSTGPKGYQRSDERMREDICDALMRARSLDTSNVTVAVSDARVVLEGTVPERRMKHAIEDLAAACPGVQDVENRVRVQTPAPSA